MQKFKADFHLRQSRRFLSSLRLTEITHAHALFSLKSTCYSARSLVLNMRLNLNWTMKERTKESQINCPCWLFFEGHHRAASFSTIPALTHTHSDIQIPSPSHYSVSHRLYATARSILRVSPTEKNGGNCSEGRWSWAMKMCFVLTANITVKSFPSEATGKPQTRFKWKTGAF